MDNQVGRPAAELLQQNAVLLQLATSSPGVTRTIGQEHVCDSRQAGDGRPAGDDVAVTIDAAIERFTVAKAILQSPELRRVNNLDFKTRMWLKTKCLPSRFIHAGMYWLPLAEAESVLSTLEEYIQDRAVLIEEFLAAYPRQVEEAQVALRRLFDAEEYPDVATMRSQFSVSYEIFSINTSPDQLRSVVTEATMKKASARAEEMWQATANQINQALAASLSALVGKLAEKLEGGKRLRKDATKQIEAFLDSLDQRNITGSAELTRVAEQARAVMAGLDIEAAKASDDYRAKILTSVQDVSATLDTMLEDVPTRIIDMVE